MASNKLEIVYSKPTLTQCDFIFNGELIDQGLATDVSTYVARVIISLPSNAHLSILLVNKKPSRHLTDEIREQAETIIDEDLVRLEDYKLL